MTILNLGIIFTKRNFLLIGLLITIIRAAAAYINWPGFLSKINPDEKIDLANVTYPQAAYRSQNLPISINIMNNGNFGKDVMVEVLSSNSDRIINNTGISSGGSANLLVNLPVKSCGNQSFKVNVYWKA